MPKPYNPKDRLMIKAKQQGFRARSVYKLKELDQKFNLLLPGMKVLDIGAAPGSWLQFISQKVGPKGLGIGIDLQPIKPISQNIVTKIGDIREINDVNSIIDNLNIEKFDLIVSDAAPNTSGIKEVDQYKSIELCRGVVQIAKNWLKTQGILVMKVFRGGDFEKFIKDLKYYFSQVKIVKVKASRDRSQEVYIICK